MTSIDQRRKSSVVGSTLAIIAAICFGFMGLFRSWADSVSVEMVLFLRFAIAGVLMFILMRARGERFPRGMVLLGLIGMGAGLYVAESMFFFHALNHIPQGMVSLLLYIYPVLVTIFAWAFFRERMTKARLIALTLAACGLALTISPSFNDTRSIQPGANAMIGIALGVACCISYAIYILVGGEPTRRAGAIPASTVVIISAAIVLGALAIGKGDQFPRTPSAWLGVAMLAIASTVVAITCVLVGLERIGPVQTSTLSTLEPVMTVLVGALLMDQNMSLIQILGGGLIVAAAVIVARSTAGTPNEMTAVNIEVAEIH